VGDRTWVRLEEPENGQPENMTEQAKRPLNLKGESQGVDICTPKWPEHGPETLIGRGLNPSNALLLQGFSRVERVTGIEPALSAWEADVLPLNYTRTCADRDAPAPRSAV
jgi:hypothetical protein